MSSRQMVATPSIELMGRAAVTMRHDASREDMYRMRLFECISFLHVMRARGVAENYMLGDVALCTWDACCE